MKQLSLETKLINTEIKMNKTINNQVLKMLKKAQAVITDDHFVYTSGKHGKVYVNKDALYPHTKFSSQIGKLFAQKYKNLDIDAVCAPALGGIVLSQWTAYYLSIFKRKEVLGLYTEKDLEKNQIFTRGYNKFVDGKNVLVVEDLTTTGGSVLKVVESVRNAGGNVVGVGVMVNRDPENVNSKLMGAPFFCLAVLEAQAWEEKDCPLCKKNIPVNTNVGHGRKYLENNKTTK
jgi:orotate phosphoribosyltransferase